MTTSYIFSNNATSTLASNISSTTTIINLSVGSGSLFPSPDTDEQFALTLVDAQTGLNTEICYCTSRSGDALTVIRGQEGTTATNWSAGDTAANFLTAGTISSWLQQSDLQPYIDIATGNEEDIQAAIIASGQTLNTSDHTQLTSAIKVLGNAPVWSSAFSGIINGYPNRFLVQDQSTPGTFWVSTAANNKTTPGANGASWVSLFNGYITSAQSDARYILGLGNASQDIRVSTLTRNATDKLIYAQSIDGTTTSLQPSGDYATNTSLNSEVTRAKTAEASLVAYNTSQGNAVASMGIVSVSGQPYCVDTTGKLRYIVKSPGSTTTDIPIQSVGINNQRIYVSYNNDSQAAWLVRSPAEGSTDTQVGAVGLNGNKPYFAYGGSNSATTPLWLVRSPAAGSPDTQVGSIGISGNKPYFAYGGTDAASTPIFLVRSPAYGSSDTRVGAVGINGIRPYLTYGGTDNDTTPLFMGREDQMPLPLGQKVQEFFITIPQGTNTGIGQPGFSISLPQAFSTFSAITGIDTGSSVYTASCVVTGNSTADVWVTNSKNPSGALPGNVVLFILAFGYY